MQKFLIAPSAFKGSLSPTEVANAIKDALDEFAKDPDQPNTIYSKIIPLADGGDGTLEAISAAVTGQMHEIDCLDALGNTHKTPWLETSNFAIVELASTCGIAGLKSLAPMQAHTRGLGQVLRHIIKDKGIRNVMVAVGGSASTDAGSGALYEMGARFFTAQGKEVIPEGAASLEKIASCDLSSLEETCLHAHIKVAVDVSNPLTGSDGAASVYGPQKGANATEIKTMDRLLTKFADMLETASQKPIRHEKGMGAAGGTAFGLACAAHAEIVPGFDWISEIVQLEESIVRSDIVITGEGTFDQSSLSGKASGQLIQLCKNYHKKLWLIAGSADKKIDPDHEGITKIIIAVKGKKLADKNDIQKAVLNALKQK